MIKPNLTDQDKHDRSCLTGELTSLPVLLFCCRWRLADDDDDDGCPDCISSSSSSDDRRDCNVILYREAIVLRYRWTMGEAESTDRWIVYNNETKLGTLFILRSHLTRRLIILHECSGVFFHFCQQISITSRERERASCLGSLRICLVLLYLSNTSMRCRIARDARWTLAGYCRRITATDASRLGCKSRNDTRKRFKFLSCIYIDERNVTEDRLKWTRKTTTDSKTCISHSEKYMLKQRQTDTHACSRVNNWTWTDLSPTNLRNSNKTSMRLPWLLR